MGRIKSVTIRISSHPSGQADFPVTLIENDDGRNTPAALPETSLTQGNWTANLAGSDDPPPTDIVQHFSNAGGAGRRHPDFTAIAETLFNWLLPSGAVRQRWIELDNASQPPVYLDVQVDGLAQLPWELACNPHGPKLRPALINGLYRQISLEPSPVLPCSAWPFRILIVVGCSEADEATLGVAEEVAQIERTFIPLGRSVDVHCMYRPDKNTLKEWVRKFHPHVFHFAGHGGKRPGPGGQFGLRFDVAPPGGPWIWTPNQIDVDLRAWRWRPKFVFLNACRSAAEQGGNWNVQRSFLAGGAQASLGMQADVRGNLAGTFASRLYNECASGKKTLEEAVFEARLEMAGKLQSYDEIDWAVPALTVTGQGLKLFEPRPRPEDPPFEKCGEFEEARFFANCREPRREFTHWTYPVIEAGSTPNVLVVTGEPRSGKSHLLKWCMETWAWGGARARYIELHTGQVKSFLSLVRQIRDGESDGTEEAKYLHAGLPGPAFKRFNWELNNLLRTGQPGEWVEADHPEPEITDHMDPWTARGERRLEEDVCAGLLKALKAAAGQRPLILVFDRMGGPNGERLLPPPDFERLIEYLFRPIAEDPTSQIKLVFCATDAEAVDYKLSLIPADKRIDYKVPVDVLPEKLGELANEMLWFREPKVKLLAIQLAGFPADSNAPKGLAQLEAVLTMLKRRASNTLLADIRRMR